MNKKPNVFDRVTKITLVVSLMGLIINDIFGVYLKISNGSGYNYTMGYYFLGIAGLIFIFSAIARKIFTMKND